MGKMAIGYDDKVRSATSIVASSFKAELPGANVGTAQPSKVWQSQTGTTTANIIVDLGATFTIGAVALINTNLSATGTWRIRLSTVDTTGAAGNAYDSTVLTAGVDTTYKKAVKIFTNAAGRYLRIDLVDATLSYLEVGRLAALKVFAPTYNFSTGAQIFYRDFSKRFNGDDGQNWTLRGSMQRGIIFSLPAVTDAERNTDGEALILATGMSQDILIVRDQASTNMGRDSIWGMMEELPIWTLFFNGYATLPMKVMDRL